MVLNFGNIPDVEELAKTLYEAGSEMGVHGFTLVAKKITDSKLPFQAWDALSDEDKRAWYFQAGWLALNYCIKKTTKPDAETIAGFRDAAKTLWGGTPDGVTDSVTDRAAANAAANAVDSVTAGNEEPKGQ
jgi:hypothetical protein